MKHDNTKKTERADIDESEGRDEPLPEKLKARKSDFSKWYNQVIQLAGLIDKRYPVKGAYVWLGYGFKAMQNIKKIWDKEFQDAGIEEMYFPLTLPIEFAKINSSWFDGFKDQAFWITSSEEKEPQYMLRPTGEAAMYPMFKMWMRSKNDLPIRIYNTVTIFRYETKHTRPIIRDREITVWYEIHTVHATQKEADEEAMLHCRLVDVIWDKIAVEPLRIRKPLWECFPGSVGAIEYYNVMPHGKALENGSINILGQAYAKKFDLTFSDEHGNLNYAWQVCTGNGARYLVAAIAAHGDDKGLIIPPEIAPIQVRIVPIFYKDEKADILKKAEGMKNKLKEHNITVDIDLREETPGFKFYDSELKGIPIRLEIGPKDMAVQSVTLVRRDTSEKIIVKDISVIEKINLLLTEIQRNLHEQSKKQLHDSIKDADSFEAICKALDEEKIVRVSWCGQAKCFDEIKKLRPGIELFGTDLKKHMGKCAICNHDSDEVGYIANTY